MSQKKSYFYLVFYFIFTILCLSTEIGFDNDVSLFLFVTFLCVLTDLGGYVLENIKRSKLTKYSPNKTYSGLLEVFPYHYVNSINSF